jgi:hypothetical protein
MYNLPGAAGGGHEHEHLFYLLQLELASLQVSMYLLSLNIQKFLETILKHRAF